MYVSEMLLHIVRAAEGIMANLTLKPSNLVVMQGCPFVSLEVCPLGRPREGSPAGCVWAVRGVLTSSQGSLAQIRKGR